MPCPCTSWADKFNKLLTTHPRRWRFSGPVTDVLCKLPFAEFFEKNRIRCKRSLPDFHQRCEQDCSRTGRFQKCDSARTTHTRRMRFSGLLTGVLCKRPFPEFVAKIRIQRQRSSADIYQIGRA